MVTYKSRVCTSKDLATHLFHPCGERPCEGGLGLASFLHVKVGVVQDEVHVSLQVVVGEFQPQLFTFTVCTVTGLRGGLRVRDSYMRWGDNIYLETDTCDGEIIDKYITSI